MLVLGTAMQLLFSVGEENYKTKCALHTKWHEEYFNRQIVDHFTLRKRRSLWYSSTLASCAVTPPFFHFDTDASQSASVFAIVTPEKCNIQFTIFLLFMEVLKMLRDICAFFLVSKIFQWNEKFY